MTPTDEIAGLRRVVEAMTMAEHALHNAVTLWGARATDMPQLAWLQQVGEAREALANAARRIDALRAASPPAVGKTVELVLCVDHGGGAHMHERGAVPSWAHGWRRLGTVRLPLIPTVEEPK